MPTQQPVDVARRVALVLAGLWCLGCIAVGFFTHWVVVMLAVALTPFFLLASLICLEYFRAAREQMKEELGESRTRFWGGLAAGLLLPFVGTIAYCAGVPLEVILLVGGLSLPFIWAVSLLVRSRLESE
jgi:hypothetical protein